MLLLLLLLLLFNSLQKGLLLIKNLHRSMNLLIKILSLPSWVIIKYKEMTCGNDQFVCACLKSDAIVDISWNNFLGGGLWQDSS